MAGKKPLIPLILTFSLLLPGALPGRGLPFPGAEAAELGGSVRAAWWSAAKTPEKNSDAASAALWLKGSVQLLPENGTLNLAGWERNDSLFRGGKTKGDVTEAYADLTGEYFDLRLGRQIIAWGKADALNPTDNLSTRDFTIPAPDDNDQRTGAAALMATVNREPFRVSAIWLPEFRPHVLPIPPLPGINLSEELPAQTPDQWAAKIEYYGSDYDWSVSWFQGFDRNPDLALKGVGAQGMDIAMEHGRIRALGADGAINFGRYGLRAEAAYIDTENGDGKNLFVKNPALYIVAGADRTFGDYLNVNLQFAYRNIFNHTGADANVDPAAAAVAREEQSINNQLEAAQQGITVRVGDKWLNETLEAEVSGMMWFARGDYLVRPRVKYAVSDTLTLTLGGDCYGGPKNSYFGRLADASAFFVEVRRGF